MENQRTRSRNQARNSSSLRVDFDQPFSIYASQANSSQQQPTPLLKANFDQSHKQGHPGNSSQPSLQNRDNVTGGSSQQHSYTERRLDPRQNGNRIVVWRRNSSEERQWTKREMASAAKETRQLTSWATSQLTSANYIGEKLSKKEFQQMRSARAGSLSTHLLRPQRNTSNLSSLKQKPAGSAQQQQNATSNSAAAVQRTHNTKQQPKLKPCQVRHLLAKSNEPATGPSSTDQKGKSRKSVSFTARTQLQPYRRASKYQEQRKLTILCRHQGELVDRHTGTVRILTPTQQEMGGGQHLQSNIRAGRSFRAMRASLFQGFQTQGTNQQRKLDGKRIVKQANSYFHNHPTCLKRPPSDSESQDSLDATADKAKKSKRVASLPGQGNSVPRAADSNLKTALAYSLLLANAEKKKNKNRLPLRNPYYEDREGYNLENCIHDKRKPNFGYPCINELNPSLSQEQKAADLESLSNKKIKSYNYNDDSLSSVIRFEDKAEEGGSSPHLNRRSHRQASSQRTSSFDFDMIKPYVIAMKREKQFMNHVLKCFTFGKPVRRDYAEVVDVGTRIDEIKRKFNRVRLIRRYFSIKRRNLQRKFDFPVDHLGRIESQKTTKQDFQQYCVESDIEHEYPRRTLAERISFIEQVKDLKFQQLGIHANLKRSIKRVNQDVDSELPSSKRSVLSQRADRQTSSSRLKQQTRNQVRKNSDLQSSSSGDDKSSNSSSSRKSRQKTPVMQYQGEYGSVPDFEKGQRKRRKIMKKGGKMRPVPDTITIQDTATTSIQPEVNIFKRGKLDASMSGAMPPRSRNGRPGTCSTQKDPPSLKPSRNTTSRQQHTTVSFDHRLSDKLAQLDSNNDEDLSAPDQRQRDRRTKSSQQFSAGGSAGKGAPDLGYFSGREFCNLSNDLNRGYCSSVASMYEEDLKGKGHVPQPFDFFTQRKTKRFFKEDFLNLTKAATNKDYISHQYKREIHDALPQINNELFASELAYNNYLTQIQKADNPSVLAPRAPLAVDPSSPKSKYASVQPHSPTWKRLTKTHRQPEKIRVVMETALTKEIPETTQNMRQASQIPLKYEVNRVKIRKAYRQFLGKPNVESSDSEYESANLRQLLKKKRDKGATAKTILQTVETRIQNKKAQQIGNYGHRSQHLQERDDENRLLNITFMRSQQQATLREKRANIQKVQQFKQGISQEQMQVLKDRQFVIVDQAQLLGRKTQQQKQMQQQNSVKSVAKSIAHNKNSQESSDKSQSGNLSQENAETNSKDSLENTRPKSSIDLLDIEDEEMLNKHKRRVKREVKELKEILAAKSETVHHKNLLKNSEFNRDVRRKFNRYKRQVRERLIKQQEEEEQSRAEQLELQQQLSHDLMREGLQKMAAAPSSAAKEKNSQMIMDMIGNVLDSVSAQKIQGGKAAVDTSTLMTSELAYGATTDSTIEQNTKRQLKHKSISMGNQNNMLIEDSSCGPDSGSSQRISVAVAKMENEDQRLQKGLPVPKQTTDDSSSRQHQASESQFLNTRSDEQSNNNDVMIIGPTNVQSIETPIKHNNHEIVSNTTRTKARKLIASRNDLVPIMRSTTIIQKNYTSRVNNNPSINAASQRLLTTDNQSVYQDMESSTFNAIETAPNQQLKPRSSTPHNQQVADYSSHRSRLTQSTSFGQEAYKHIPSEAALYELPGDMIEDALSDVPKMPAKYDKRNEQVMGIYDDMKKGAKFEAAKPRPDFSKFMLERMKKHSILNHDVFKHDGVDYKERVAKNLQNFQRVIRRHTSSTKLKVNVL